MNIILKDIFCFNMKDKEQREGNFFVYLNEVLKPKYVRRGMSGIKGK